jgi:pimeloyl-ACP methyl ester carboxylesterase
MVGVRAFREDVRRRPAVQADLIRTALARRDVARAIVVGHSLAGALSLALALDAPQFTRALVLLAPVSHPWPGGVAWRYPLSATPLLGWAFRRLVVMPVGLLTLRSGMREVFAPSAAPIDYAERTALELVLRPKHFCANAEDVVDLKAFVIKQVARYRSIAAPTEIVTGDSDGVVSAELHSAGCARDIPGAALTILPGVGHSPHHSATDAVVAAILRAEARAIAKERAPTAARIGAEKPLLAPQGRERPNPQPSAASCAST